MRSALLCLTVLCLTGCRSKQPLGNRIRLGLYPNVTHAPALVGVERGVFKQAVAPVELETKGFSNGPEAMEALYAGALDACFIGPIPAVNGYLRSEGRALKIVAGATSGGAALVVRADAGIAGPGDLSGKKVATPQLGNTQDLALRRYIEEHGMKPKERGGQVFVLPIANPDALQLMRGKQLDAAWAPEPWVTRLLHEANGKILVDERDLWPERRFPSAVLVLSQRLLDEKPEVAEKLVRAHLENLAWMHAHPSEIGPLVRTGLQHLGQKPLPLELVEEALGRMEFTSDALPRAIELMVAESRKLGYMPRSGDAQAAFDLRWVQR